MVIHQLFTELPPLKLCESVVRAFGLDGLDDSSPFTRADVVARGVPAAVEELDLAGVYLACKRFYCERPLTPERCLTILRHFLRAAGHVLKATDATLDGRRTQTYRVHQPGRGVVRVSHGTNVI